MQLNVFAPIDAVRGEKLPVFVFVHAGSFADGYGTMPYGFAARQIIQVKRVIIVTMNYRLGAFGFLPLSELEDDGDLNLGIKDVAESFRWVRKHINEFGGDSKSSTGWGFSAGAGNMPLIQSYYPHY